MEIQDGGETAYDPNVAEPTLVIVADCHLDELYNPFSGEVITKESFGQTIVIIDLIVVLSFLVFTQWIEYSQKLYVKSYKDHAIEMSDFTIRVKNIPHHDQYGKDDELLRGHLIQHFQRVILD